MRGLIQHITLALLIITGVSAYAQKLNVKAELDTSSIRIGEQTTLKLTAFFTEKSGKQISWPKVSDTITAKIEVVSAGKIDTQVVSSGQEIFTQKLIVTSFDSGYHPLPPFTFSVKGDTSAFAETEALLLDVTTIRVDTTQAIKDIKGPMEAPFTWREALPYIIGGAIIVAIIILIIYLFRRSRRKIVKAPEPEIRRSPDEIALEQIDILEKEKLWQSGKFKEFYIRLSDILRVYVEQRYRISALEQTSDDLLLSLRSIIEDSQRLKLRQVLLLSDLVKFAKEIPVAPENEMSVQNAKEFITGTKQVAEDKKQSTEQ